MTNEEAIENLKGLLESNYVDSFEDTENKALEMAIKALEQKPCNTDTCKVVKAYMNEWDKPITAEPKTGHWVEENINEWSHKVFCSECGCTPPFEHVSNGDVYSASGYGVTNKTKFCPNCGAKMAESEE